jgi:hypothetical protein
MYEEVGMKVATEVLPLVETLKCPGFNALPFRDHVKVNGSLSEFVTVAVRS